LILSKIKEGNIDISMLLIASLIMIIFPIRTDNLSFILLTLICLCFFSYNTYSKRHPILISALDISWVAFIGMGLLSFLWANDGALIWMRSFGWITYFTWMIMIRLIIKIPENKDTVHNWLIGLFILSLLFVFGIIAFHKFEVTIPFFWENFYGNNENVTMLHLTLLLPYFLYCTNKSWFKYLIFLVVLMFSLMLHLTTARGATIGFLIVMSLYFVDTIPIKLLKRIGYVCTSIIALVLISFLLDFLNFKDIPFIDRLVDLKS